MKAANDVTKKQLAELLKTANSRSKYGSRNITVDGERFDSEGEAARFYELTLLQRKGIVVNLCRQVRYPLYVNDVRVTTYIADFVYDERQPDGSFVQVVEDFKGYRTNVYRLKAKLFAAVMGFELRETS